MSSQSSANEDSIALAEKAKQGTEDFNAPGKHALSTLITLGIGIVLGGAALGTCLLMSPSTPSRPLVGLLAGVMGVVAVAGVLKWLIEFWQVAPNDRTTPEKALKAYLSSLHQLRWHAASTCLSWAAKDGNGMDVACITL